MTRADFETYARTALHAGELLDAGRLEIVPCPCGPGVGCDEWKLEPRERERED